MEMSNVTLKDDCVQDFLKILNSRSSGLAELFCKDAYGGNEILKVRCSTRLSNPFKNVLDDFDRPSLSAASIFSSVSATELISVLNWPLEDICRTSRTVWSRTMENCRRY